MDFRSILLAIGVAVGIFAVSAGIRVDPCAFGASGAGLRVVGPGDGVRLEAPRSPGVVREVTAYNVGVRAQTSESPCIGASGRDLCRLVDEGRSVCAANFVAMGTVLRIAELGECVVLDRMHRRFSHRVDIAMKEDAVAEALEFGLQRRHVEVMD